MGLASRVVRPNIKTDGAALKLSAGIEPLGTSEPVTAALSGCGKSCIVQQPKVY